MRTLLPLLAAFALAASGCSSSNPACSADAGGVDSLKRCTPLADGGSSDCAPTEACAPFGPAGNERCVAFCSSGGACAAPGTSCSAVAVGLCSRATDGGEDGGGEGPPPCRTDFLCYPNLCPTALVN